MTTYNFQAATGIDLKMPEKKKKGKKKKKKVDGGTRGKKKTPGSTSAAVMKEIKERNFPGVSDIVTRHTAKDRLSKKLFSK